MENQCSSCNETIGDNNFCPQCGKPSHCLQCNKPFKSNEKFCGVCGAKRESPTNMNQKQNTEATTPPSNETTPAKKSFHIKNIPWFVWVIGLAIILFFGFTSMNGEEPPEKTVEGFLKAMEKQDTKKLPKYLHPLEEDVLDYLDFDDFPPDAKIEILGYGDADISGNKADIEVKVHISSEMMEVSDSEYLDFELIKNNKQWLIYDIY